MVFLHSLFGVPKSRNGSSALNSYHAPRRKQNQQIIMIGHVAQVVSDSSYYDNYSKKYSNAHPARWCSHLFAIRVMEQILKKDL